MTERIYKDRPWFDVQFKQYDRRGGCREIGVITRPIIAVTTLFDVLNPEHDQTSQFEVEPDFWQERTIDEVIDALGYVYDGRDQWEALLATLGIEGEALQLAADGEVSVSENYLTAFYGDLPHGLQSVIRSVTSPWFHTTMNFDQIGTP